MIVMKNMLQGISYLTHNLGSKKSQEKTRLRFIDLLSKKVGSSVYEQDSDERFVKKNLRGFPPTNSQHGT